MTLANRCAHAVYMLSYRLILLALLDAAHRAGDSWRLPPRARLDYIGWGQKPIVQEYELDRIRDTCI